VTYLVTVKRTITTVVRVDGAASAVAARRRIMNYGIVEAVSDFPVVEETMDAIIVPTQKHLVAKHA